MPCRRWPLQLREGAGVLRPHAGVNGHGAHPLAPLPLVPRFRRRTHTAIGNCTGRTCAGVRPEAAERVRHASAAPRFAASQCEACHTHTRAAEALCAHAQVLCQLTPRGACAGTVTCAEIWGGTHLLTGSEDKTIVVWRTKDWVSLSTLRGHREKLSALAVHPSGKLALASDIAGTLYLWNLTSAKCVFKHRTPESSVLRWSPDGQAYASVHKDKVEVSTTGAETLCHVAPKGGGRVFDMAFVDDNVLLTGGEDKTVSAWDLRSGDGGSTVTAPSQSSGTMSTRIKAIKTFEAGGAKYCAAASAGGSVAVHDLRRFGSEPVMTYETRSRLTCMEAVESFEGEAEEEHDEHVEEEEQGEQEEEERETTGEEESEPEAGAGSAVSSKRSKRQKR
jgi:hypothetical protein